MAPAPLVLSTALHAVLAASLLCSSSVAALSYADKHALRAWPSVRSVRTVRTSVDMRKPKDTTPPMGYAHNSFSRHTPEIPSLPSAHP